MSSVKDVASVLEEFAPLSYQESYDNSGLQVGDSKQQVAGVLLAIDVTEDVVTEAISHGCNLIIAHHPLIFGGIKRLTGKNYVERTIIKALKNDIAIYACHTNFDNIMPGVSFRMADKLGLIQVKPLKPLEGVLCKIVAFVPEAHADKVRNVIFEAGAGHIGQYDCCSFNVNGCGTFRASEQANPFVGEKGKLHTEPEVRIETVIPKHLQDKVVSAMLKAHPYEEVAYDIYPLTNSLNTAGGGVIGQFGTAMSENEFLALLKQVFNTGCIRHTAITGAKISTVALCGGSGSSMLGDALQANVDAFVTADFKYHQFFDADGRILIADIGHFESEQFTTEIFYEILIKNFSNFAIRFTKVKTNPINYI